MSEGVNNMNLPFFVISSLSTAPGHTKDGVDSRVSEIGVKIKLISR